MMPDGMKFEQVLSTTIHSFGLLPFGQALL
jgi:hypothetical protein